MRLVALLLAGSVFAAPASAQTPAPAEAAPPVINAPGQPEIVRSVQSLGRTPGDMEVDEVMLSPIPVVLTSVRGRTEQILEIIPAGFATLNRLVAQAQLTLVGQPLVVYLELGDEEFVAELMLPVVEVPPSPPPGLRTGRSPAGRAVRIVHAGAYETMNETYDELSTFVEDKQLAVREIVVERYMNDPRTTASTDLLTEIYVLLR